MHRISSVRYSASVAIILMCPCLSFALDALNIFAADLIDSRSTEILADAIAKEGPPGGYLYSFALELIGGAPLFTFVSSSLDADRDFCTWKIYQKTADGSDTQIGRIQMPNTALRKRIESGVNIYSFVIFTHPSYQLVEFGIDTDGTFFTRQRALTSDEISFLNGESSVRSDSGVPDQDTIATHFKMGEAVDLTIHKALLDDVVEDRERSPLPVKDELSLVGNAQSQDPADTSAIAKVLSTWSAEVTGDSSAPLKIASLSSVVTDWTKQITGDKAVVVNIIPEGTVPQTFEPGYKELYKMLKSDTIFAAGKGLEASLQKIQGLVGKPGKIVEIGNSVDSLFLTDADGGKRENPFWWLNVQNAREATVSLREHLVALMPANKAFFEANAVKYDASLANLEQRLSQGIAQIPVERRRLAGDPAQLQYFAQPFHIPVVAVGPFVSLDSTQALSNAQVKDEASEVIKKIQEHGLQSLVPTNKFNLEVFNQAAAETGIHVKPRFDVTTTVTGPESDYIGMMLHNATLVDESAK